MPTSPEDERSATVLLITDEPWIHKALREALGLTQVEQGASGVEYDTGQLKAADGVWKLVLPVDSADGASLLAENAPALVVFIAAKHHAIPTAIEQSVICAAELSLGELRVPTSPVLVRRFERALRRGLVRNGRVEAGGISVPKRLWSAIAPSDGAGARSVLGLVVPIDVYSPALRGGAPDLDPGVFRGLFDALLSSYSLESLGAPVQRVTPTPPMPPALIPVRGTLASVELFSIRMFEQVCWGPVVSQPGWHVVLGDNGSGKTSLLRALALALLARADRDALRQDWTSWLRHDTPRGHIAVTVGAESTTPHTLTLSLERAVPGTAGSQTVVDVRSSETLQYLGFLAGYGSFRRFTGGDPEWLTTFRAHPRTQRVITLFEVRAALSDALEWIKDLWVRAETRRSANTERSFLSTLLRFINQTGFLPPGMTLLKPDADGVWCRDANGMRLAILDLSDGYQAALSLALDLLRHLATEFGPHRVFGSGSGKPTTVQAEGVVLIDEPDAHLHPTWQQRLGGWFKQFFPRMQFVVTTHSPIVCQAADSVLLLPPPGDDQSPRMLSGEELARLRYGDVLDAFATDFFGHRVTRSQAGREKLDRLAALNLKAVQAGLEEAEKAEQETLRAELGTAGEAPGEGQPS